MLESIKQQLNPYIPSRKQVRTVAAGFVFVAATALALKATMCAVKSINEAVQLNSKQTSSNSEIPPNSKKV